MLYEEANLGLRMLYSGMALSQMALADVLKGPAYFVDSLPSKLGEVRKARSGFADSTTFTSRWIYLSLAIMPNATGRHRAHAM
mgnify:FL=1